jgi:hypothetical protein
MYLKPTPDLKCHGLKNMCVCLGPAPHTPPSLPSLYAPICVGTLPCWEPVWLYPVKITNIQVDITFINLWRNSMNQMISMKWCQLEYFWFWPGIVTLTPDEEEFPCMCGQEDQAMKEAWELGAGPNRTQMWFSPGHLKLTHRSLISTCIYWIWKCTPSKHLI